MTPRIMTGTKADRAAVLKIATGAKVKRAKPRHLEAIEQRLFVKRWRLDPRTRDLPACAIPNGGKRGAREAALLRAEGVSAGVPDWLCFTAGTEWEIPVRIGGLSDAAEMVLAGRVGMAIEIKSPDGAGRLSSAQADWHTKLRANGWRVEIVTSAAQAWSVVCDYLGITP